MISPSGSQGGEIASRESIELSFSTVKQEYVVQNQQGGSGGNRSYFLHDLLTQFIFREAHLVEPNLQWAWRYRLLRLGGHLLVLVLAFLLWQGMQTSQQTNGDYFPGNGRRYVVCQCPLP